VVKSKLPASAEQLSCTLLDWYRTQRRDLPWRRDRDPYRIWISEVMLQQTQAAVVIPYFRRFMDRFPNVETLAAAELTEILGLWSGLGYYARARSLHAAAQKISAAGHFPETLEALRALPGFGPYTAAAVASIAFDLPEPAIDGNAVRVYARLFGLRAPRARAEPALRELTRPLLRAAPPGDLNQAIMDLGQRVCTPRAPLCLLCPWRRHCRAYREGAVAEIPTRTKPKPRRQLIEVAARVVRRGRILMARRCERGLFGGLWELPGGEITSTRQRGTAPVVSSEKTLTSLLSELLLRELQLRATIGSELARVDRVLTHRELRLVAFDAQVQGRPRPTPGGRYLEARFVALEELPKLGLSSATKRLLAALGLW
jgi:A/G-specific adenine glycosylase